MNCQITHKGHLVAPAEIEHCLLSAAEQVVARWEHGDLAEAVRELAEAITRAKGETA